MARPQPTVPQDLLDRLNPEQAQAAAAVTGPVQILAGAGTGKTRTITHRVAAQVISGAFTPTQILAVTFTERAAAEMRHRIAALCGELGMPDVRIRALTFHSAAWAQVRHFWPSISDAPLPEVLSSKIPLLARSARSLGVEPSDLASEVEWAANAGLDADGVAASGRDELVDAATLARVVADYEQTKRDRGVIDYEDMLRHGVRLLDDPDTATTIRDRYRAFTVDEFQDTNALQWSLLTAWAGDRDDICVVGDPAQTIFSFTGADATYLQKFPSTFPRATTVQLTRSYRSTPQVLALANNVLGRRSPNLLPTLDGADAPVPLMRELPDDDAERKAVVSTILKLRDEGTPLREMAICYRINAQAAPWEDALREAGVRCMVRGEGSFYQRREVTQAVQALVTAVSAPPPPRGSAPPPLVDAPVANPNLMAQVDAIWRESLSWRPGSPPQGRQARERWDYIDALHQEIATMVREGLDLPAIAADLQERTTLGADAGADAVTLMSLHRAKGTEFDAVFLVALEEGLMPISYATTDEEVDEERRLLYVGVTRARRWLTMTWTAKRTNRKGNLAKRRPSRFLYGLGEGAPVAGKKAPRAQGTLTDDLPDEADPLVVERLRMWRLERSKADGVPAFVVFNDATLVELASRRPGDRRSLLKVKGFGPTKADRYGPDVLAVVAGRT